MPESRAGLQHDIGLLEQAIEISSDMLSSPLLGATDSVAIQAEIASMVGQLAALQRRIASVN